MFQFFRRVFLLFRTLWHGLKHDPDSAAMGFLLVVLLSTGKLFYHWVEGWGYLDAFYFCVMTVATVGFGDFAPTSPLSKLFTIFFPRDRAFCRVCRKGRIHLDAAPWG